MFLTRNRLAHQPLLAGIASVALVLSALAHAQEKAEKEQKLPDKYVLNYPVMDRCCPPIRSTFVEAEQTYGVVGDREFTHQPNGGYGLPVKLQVGGKHLIHLGADLGWYQVDEPVFAIGAGVVRVSTGPPPEEKKKTPPKQSDPKKNANDGPMSWGNVVMIEHRLASGDFFTTIYGHLNTDRRVGAGDIVRAGQQIGVIGKQHPQINGGYNPHVHFAVRKGRNAEIGAMLMKMRINGEPQEIKIAALADDFVQLESSAPLPPSLTLRINGESYSVEQRDGKPCLPARLLWRFSRADFPLVGYDLTTDGWRDPIAFLREMRADTQPAPFGAR